MKITALVPMKGNSQRIPNKNMKLFNGFPLYHAIIKTLLKSKYINEILINTDSQTIKNDINKYFKDKIIIINRPKNLQGDTISMNRIIDNDIKNSSNNHFIQTHSTNPLLKTETIDKAIEKYFQEINNYDSIFSVTRHQTRLYDKELKPLNHDPRKLIQTQDLDPIYEENSNFYIFSEESYNNANKKRIGLKAQFFEINKLEAIDIDYKEDFQLAEILYIQKDKILGT